MDLFAAVPQNLPKPVRLFLWAGIGGKPAVADYEALQPAICHPTSTVTLIGVFLNTRFSVSSRALLRLAAVAMAVGLPLGLLVGGAQPVAVGLIPAPWDKLAHTGVFALLAAAIGIASGWRGWPMAMLALGGAAMVGLADEWHQMFLPGRSAGWDDFAADCLGALIGTIAVWRFVSREPM